MNVLFNVIQINTNHNTELNLPVIWQWNDPLSCLSQEENTFPWYERMNWSQTLMLLHWWSWKYFTVNFNWHVSKWVAAVDTKVSNINKLISWVLVVSNCRVNGPGKLVCVTKCRFKNNQQLTWVVSHTHLMGNNSDAFTMVNISVFTDPQSLFKFLIVTSLAADLLKSSAKIHQ